jgi:hypothetical protein
MRALTTSQYLLIDGGFFEPTMMDDEEESDTSQSRQNLNKNTKENYTGE